MQVLSCQWYIRTRRESIPSGSHGPLSQDSIDKPRSERAPQLDLEPHLPLIVTWSWFRHQLSYGCEGKTSQELHVCLFDDVRSVARSRPVKDLSSPMMCLSNSSLLCTCFFLAIYTLKNHLQLGAGTYLLVTKTSEHRNPPVRKWSKYHKGILSRQVDGQTDRTDSITSSTYAGGKKQCEYQLVSLLPQRSGAPLPDSGLASIPKKYSRRTVCSCLLKLCTLHFLDDLLPQ